MSEKISEKISVNLVYDHSNRTSVPRHIKWKTHVYTITKVGLHYTVFQGNTLLHKFSVCNNDYFFLLSFNTKTLEWLLEEVTDDTTN